MKRWRRTLLKRFLKRFFLDKRRKFVLVTLLLTLGLLATQLVSLEQRHQMVLGLAISSYLLSAWALKEELNGVEWITLLSLPSLYTAAVSLFYFLLPVRWLTRLPTMFFFAIGMYALLLTENIFNVAVERSIQLVRAARSIGLLITLITIFLWFNTLFAFRLSASLNGLLAGFISFPLILQALWSVTLRDDTILALVWSYTLGICLILVEVTFFLSFWPIKGNIAALFITALTYTLVGLGQQRLLDRLFVATIRELVLVSAIIFLLISFATRWGG